MQQTFKTVRKYGSRLAVGAGVVSSIPAFAAGTGPDFSTITAAVDLTTVGAGILALAVLMMGPKVYKWGAAKVMSMMKG